MHTARENAARSAMDFMVICYFDRDKDKCILDSDLFPMKLL
jgi:hypothetical protein